MIFWLNIYREKAMTLPFWNWILHFQVRKCPNWTKSAWETTTIWVGFKHWPSAGVKRPTVYYHFLWYNIFQRVFKKNMTSYVDHHQLKVRDRPISRPTWSKRNWRFCPGRNVRLNGQLITITTFNSAPLRQTPKFARYRNHQSLLSTPFFWLLDF